MDDKIPKCLTVHPEFTAGYEAAKRDFEYAIELKDACIKDGKKEVGRLKREVERLKAYFENNYSEQKANRLLDLVEEKDEEINRLKAILQAPSPEFIENRMEIQELKEDKHILQELTNALKAKVLDLENKIANMHLSNVLPRSSGKGEYGDGNWQGGGYEYKPLQRGPVIRCDHGWDD